MKLLRPLHGLVLAAAILPAALHGQTPLSAVGDEHRYLFVLTEAPAPFAEKMTLEAFGNLDPEMRVNIDRSRLLMKVLAYRPLDEQVFIALAAEHGITLLPRHPRMGAAATNLTDQ